MCGSAAPPTAGTLGPGSVDQARLLGARAATAAGAARAGVATLAGTARAGAYGAVRFPSMLCPIM